jgi:transposase InsO family protein
VISEALSGLEPFTSVKAACALLGKPRATLYRQRNPPRPRERPPGPRAVHPAALSAAEQEQLLAVLNVERFADKSPAQTWAVLLDEGVYLASVSTMYRVLRAADQVRERRAQAAHPARARPELTADGPSQIWSQDITKLKGPARGIWFDLFVMPGIFSRKAIHWEVHATENAELAKAFIDAAVISNGGIAPLSIHAGRGTSMTSKPVAVLLSDLHISQSHSRPHVSNDNPYSEAQFKTLKYCPAFPGQFGSLPDARAFSEVFFGYYNNEHRHSGIGLHTPPSVHDGTATQIQARRARVLQQAYAARPGRFRQPPKPPRLPARVWINQPPATIETEVAPHKNQAA